MYIIPIVARQRLSEYVPNRGELLDSLSFCIGSVSYQRGVCGSDCGYSYRSHIWFNMNSKTYKRF
jgi:hypothetical protein